MDNRIEPGHCWVSGKEIREIISRWPQSHPLAGHVMEVGKVLPECSQVTFLLTDGCRMTLCIHKDHLKEINLNDLWHTIIEAEQSEYQRRQHFPYYNEGNANQSHQNQLKRICPPIGILEVKHG